MIRYPVGQISTPLRWLIEHYPWAAWVLMAVGLVCVAVASIRETRDRQNE